MARDRHLVDGLAVERRPHLARHLAVQLADGVDVVRRAERQRRHVELRAVAVVVAAEREEVLAAIAEVAPAAGEVGLDLVEREGVVAGGTGVCVVKTVLWRTRVSASSNEQALLEELVDALQHHEAGVALVQVPHRRIEPEGAQRRGRRRCRG